MSVARDVPRSGSRSTAARPARNSLRAASAIFSRPTQLAPIGRPKKLLCSSSSSCVPSSDADSACRSSNPDSGKTRCGACRCSQTPRPVAELRLAYVAWALPTSFLWASTYFNTDTPPRTGVLVKRLQSSRRPRMSAYSDSSPLKFLPGDGTLSMRLLCLDGDILVCWASEASEAQQLYQNMLAARYTKHHDPCGHGQSLPGDSLHTSLVDHSSNHPLCRSDAERGTIGAADPLLLRLLNSAPQTSDFTNLVSVPVGECCADPDLLVMPSQSRQCMDLYWHGDSCDALPNRSTRRPLFRG